MSLHDKAAGSHAFFECPNCNGVIKIYSRSFAGNGKKYPHCFFVIAFIPGRDLTKVEVYEFRRCCPVCKKKLIKTNIKDPKSPRYCQLRKSHHKE